MFSENILLSLVVETEQLDQIRSRLPVMTDAEKTNEVIIDGCIFEDEQMMNVLAECLEVEVSDLSDIQEHEFCYLVFSAD